ncbi:MAG: L-threonylcarbamoyladenylate synthase [Candidatus Kapaibacterium sp.]
MVTGFRSYGTEKLDALRDGSSAIRRAASLIAQGLPVAFPTETVYGLGARVFDPVGIQEIFRVKGRPQDNPLIVHVAQRHDIGLVAASIPETARMLVDTFFPGPLTIVLRRKDDVPDLVSAGLPTIAVRMPDHEVALELIAAVGQPLVAPSANKSGRPSPTSARHVLDDLDGSIAAVLDGGACRVGIESTVVSLVHPKPLLLRPGVVARGELEDVLGSEILLPDPQRFQAPESPGMKYRHYAPSIPVLLVNESEAMAMANEKSYVLCASDVHMTIHAHALETRTYYHHLREAERLGYRDILVVRSRLVEGNEALFERIRKSSDSAERS